MAPMSNCKPKVDQSELHLVCQKVDESCSFTESLAICDLPLQSLSTSFTPNVCFDLSNDNKQLINSEEVCNILCTGKLYQMIGDCNMFLLEQDDCTQSENAHQLTFEVEVMIAEKAFRRRGFAQKAVQMMMMYAHRVFHATCFVAKILNTNKESIALFTRKLQFTIYKHVPVFNEVHLWYNVNGDNLPSLRMLASETVTKVVTPVIMTEKVNEGIVDCATRQSCKQVEVTTELENSRTNCKGKCDSNVECENAHESLLKIICGPYALLTKLGVSFSLES